MPIAKVHFKGVQLVNKSRAYFFLGPLCPEPTEGFRAEI